MYIGVADTLTVVCTWSRWTESVSLVMTLSILRLGAFITSAFTSSRVD